MRKSLFVCAVGACLGTFIMGVGTGIIIAQKGEGVN